METTSRLRVVCAAILLLTSAGTAAGEPTTPEGKMFASRVRRTITGAERSRQRYTSDEDINKEYMADIEKLLDSDEAKTKLDAATRKEFLDQVATMRKARIEEVCTEKLTRIDREIAAAEREWKDLAPEIGGTEPVYGKTRRMESQLEQAENSLKAAPADDRVKPLAERFRKVSTAFNSAMSKRDRQATLKRLQEEWASRSAAAEGWEGEKPRPYPEFISHAPVSIEMPKTEALITGAAEWKQWGTTTAAMAVFADDPEFKSLAETVAKLHREAAAKYGAAVKALLDESEKKGVDEDARNQWNAFRPHVTSLLAGTAQEAVAQRVTGLVKKADAGAEAAAKGKQELLVRRVKEANEAWPKIAARYPAAAKEIDPQAILKTPDAYKDKLFQLSGVRNRSGWEFQDRSYDFVTMINGTPVCGKYDAAIAKTIEQAEQATGQRIGHDSHDLIVRVEGTCRVAELFYSQALEEWRPKAMHEGVLVKVIALHTGPVACPK